MKRTVIAVVVVLSTGLLVWIGLAVRPPVNSLPDEIRQQADFGIYFLRHDIPGYVIKAGSVKISHLEGVYILNFIIVGPGGEVTLSEQSYPEALIYDKFTNSLNPDGEAGTVYGKLTIGHPKDAKGQQVAGMKINDTLLLGRPTNDLNSKEWLDIVNGLELAK